MENIKETTVPAEQAEQNSQDDAIASAKQRIKNSYEKKIANEYVPIEKFNELQEKYNKIDAELKLPKITKQLIDAGMKEQAVANFIKLHPEVMNSKDDAITKLVEETKKTDEYMFDSKAFTATALPPNPTNKPEGEKQLYTLDDNGFVIKNQ